ncbi:MAG: hypothetical protein K8R36_00500 [Planctomycetales bacterium]|nr:hypothetical protein [Planctomycetales bacterium]
MSVAASLIFKHMPEASRHVFRRVIQELTPREFAKIGKRSLKGIGVPICIEHDRMHVRRHNYKGIDPQALVLMAEVQAIGDDSTCPLGYEHWQPIHDAERQVVRPRFGDKTVTVHNVLSLSGVRCC